MMRRSGVSEAVELWNTLREMPRRAAAGDNLSMQACEGAADGRMAPAGIIGWPDAPDSPRQGGGGWELAGGSEPVVAGACGPCPRAIPQVAATSPTAMTIGRALCIPFPSSPSIP